MFGFYYSISINLLLILLLISMKDITYENMIKILTFSNESYTQGNILNTIIIQAAIITPLLNLATGLIKYLQIVDSMGKLWIIYIIMPLLTLITVIIKLKIVKKSSL